jgi:putative DNA primase/helicase
MLATLNTWGTTLQDEIEPVYSRIFPVDPTTKRPLIEHGFKDASDDPEQWKMWAKQFKGCSWGSPTSSQLFVIDIDKKSGGLETWAELVKKHGDPTTRTVQTMNGGQHKYFLAMAGMGEIRNSTSKFGKGIDIRGEGGYVVIPPSQGYSVVSSVEPAVAPLWIVNRFLAMNSPQIKSNGHSTTESFVLPLEIGEGSRNDTLFRYGSSLRAKGKNDDEIRMAICEANQTICSVPLDEDELEIVIKQAVRYPQGASLEDASILTDTGNADRFVQKYGDVLRYNRSFKWMAWNGKKWEFNSENLPTQCAQETARSILKDAADIVDSDHQRKAVKWALSSLNEGRLDAMMELAKAHLHSETKEFDDNHPWLLNVENGILNLQTGVLLEHDPYYRMTRVAGTSFDPNAQAPNWQAFVEMIFPDPDVRKYIQKAFGYSLTGNSDERAIYFLEGPKGNNGKSTFIEVGFMLAGEYGKKTNIKAITETGQGGLTPLNEDFYNARFVATDELDANVRFNTTQIKSLSGNDEIHCNPKYRDPFTFHPTHHLWIFGNQIVQPDKLDDAAFFSRLKRIIFDREIPAEIRRPMEEVKAMFRAELPGILNWALEGIRMYLDEGWQVPQAVVQAVQEYQNDNDYLAQFIDEQYVLEEGGKVLKAIFHTTYNEYLHQMGQPTISLKRLADQLKRFNVEVGGNGKQFYVGVRFPGAV